MTQMNTNFEKSLCKNARLFSLSKMHADLFLLLQTNTITYQQLSISKLHGHTEAAGRLSLKRLEKDGLIQSKKLPYPNQAKYYYLTSKGKNFLKELFPCELLEHFKVNWERRPPSGIQQIQHRIRTNDFYYAYVGLNESQPLPWMLEHPLSSEKASFSDQVPRCDALLVSEYGEYYIEQDNSTQSENIILQKIEQYQKSGMFSGERENPVLIFCLAFPKKQPIGAKPSFSLYRILLRFTKLWALFEEEYKIELDYQQFIQVLETSALRKTVSNNDMQNLRNLHALHPEMDTLSDATALKKAYLDDTAYFSAQVKEMDLLFQKRLKSHFKRIHRGCSGLFAYALTGKPLFAVPNHRLPLFLPFVMANECRLSEQLLQYLFYNGLNTDNWTYHTPLRINVHKQPDFYFRQGFYHRTYGYIAIEHPSIDLNAKIRIHHYLKNSCNGDRPLVLIMQAFESDIDDLLRQESLANYPNDTLTLLQMDISTPLQQLPKLQMLSSSGQRFQILFECDEFDEKLHFIRKEDFPC